MKKQEQRIGVLRQQKSKLKSVSLLAIIAVIGFMILPMTGCEEPKEEVTLSSIAVTAEPTKTDYVIGDEALDTTGMVVTAIYSDGTKKAVTGYKVSDLDSATEGEKEITVTYEGKTAKFTVTVNNAATSIVVTKEPTKKVYAIGEQFDRDGMEVTVTYADNTTGVVTDYEIDGFDSTTAGTKTVTVTYQSKIATVTVSVIGGVAAQPTANVAAGNYYAVQSVTLTTATTGAEIYYTLDGTTTPTASSTKYTSAIPINVTTTIKAIAIKDDWGNSSVLTAAYTLQASTPTATIAAGLYNTAQSVTLATTTSDATIYYTLDGTAPTASSTKFITGTPISISSTTTLKAIAVKTGWSNSAILTAEYSLQAVTPTANLDAGTYFTTQSVTLSTTTTGASIYYTIDGTTPTTSSTQFNTTTPISISSTTTVKAIAVKTGWSNSGVLTATYTISPATSLDIADKWYDGNLTSTVKEQWFKFTSAASGTTQYIHFQPGTLTAATVQLYAADGTTIVGASAYLSSSTTNMNRTVTANTVYYIKVTTSTLNGGYKIAVNTTSSSPATVDIPTTGVIDLTIGDKWTDGNIPATGGEQWFKFTQGTGTYAYILFLQGSMDNIYVQMYTTEGRTQGSRDNFSYVSYVSRSGLTANTVYYIKVTPYSSTASGTYRIGVNSSSSTLPITIPTTGVTPLTNNTWADGNITSTVSEQWFSFTAPAATTYIHFLPDTLTNVSVQLYDNNGTPVGSSASLNRGTASASRSTNVSGTTYYILLKPYSSSYSGAYKIAYGNSSTQPAITVPSGTIPELTADEWTDGNITTAGGEQWFKFKATGTSHYIHFLPGTGTGALTSVYVRLFILAGTNVGDTSNLDSSTHSANQTGLTANTDYYIKVTPYSTTGSGTYKIGFNTTTSTPKVTPSPVPSTDFTSLTFGKFSDGNIATTNGEQWFKFTSTVTGSQYIHFNTGTLSDVNVQLYTDDGRLLGSRTNLYSSNLYTSRTVTNNNIYYIKVTPFNSYSGTGTFKIGFASSSTMPITLPTEDVTTLTVGTWGDGNIATRTGEQWFKFTQGTGTSAYIHLQKGTLGDVYVQMYDANGVTVVDKTNLYGNGSQLYTSKTGLTASAEYYIRVWPYSSSGTYKLGVSTSATLPTAAP